MMTAGAKLISTKMHGVLDYTAVGALAALPRLLNPGMGVNRMLMGAAGGSLAYSLVTRYELGLVRLLPMPAHLMLDAGSALAFLASPLFFRAEAPRTRLTLLGIGITELTIVLLSQREPR